MRLFYEMARAGDTGDQPLASMGKILYLLTSLALCFGSKAPTAHSPRTIERGSTATCDAPGAVRGKAPVPW